MFGDAQPARSPTAHSVLDRAGARCAVTVTDRDGMSLGKIPVMRWSYDHGMVCEHCGHESRSSAKFCASCGQSVAPVCPRCHAPVVAGQRFCEECGTALDGSADAAADSVATARETSP